MVGVGEAGWGGLHLGRLVQMLLPGRIEFRFFSPGGGTDECRGWGGRHRYLRDRWSAERAPEHLDDLPAR